MFNLDTFHPGTLYNLRKDVKIRCFSYLSKSKGAGEQKVRETVVYNIRYIRILLYESVCVNKKNNTLEEKRSKELPF